MPTDGQRGADEVRAFYRDALSSKADECEALRQQLGAAREELRCERCDTCGCLYDTVYHLPDEVWAAVSGSEDLGGLLCSRCANDEAKVKDLDLWWEAAQGEYPTQVLRRRLEEARKMFDTFCDAIAVQDSGMAAEVAKRLAAVLRRSDD